MTSLTTVDKQTLKLIDYLIKLHKETATNLDLVTDYAFGVKYYPHNKYIVTHMRGKEVEGGKEKHAPHLLIINLAEAFNLDYNYFYNESIEAKDAFLSKNKSAYKPNNKSLDEISKEINKRFEYFAKKNRSLNNIEEKECYRKAENDLHTIKEQLNELLSSETILNKKNKAIDLFDTTISLSEKQLNTALSRIRLEESKETTPNTKDKMQQLEQKIEHLTKELIESNKMAFEAQKGQTETLKELLALKDKL